MNHRNTMMTSGITEAATEQTNQQAKPGPVLCIIHSGKHANSDKVVVTTLKEECKSNKLDMYMTHLNSSQEEADTRILLHAMDASKRGSTSICINSPDTDVLVLAVWCYGNICPDTSVVVGVGSKQRMIKLGPLHEALGEKVVSTLPGFHAGSFCGKSKIYSWNALMRAPSKRLITLEQPAQ